MKIKSLSTTSFGKFEGKSNWDDFSPSINVFYGENEAGKSTIFEMIINLLYGFKSTNKDKNLNVNRRTNELNIKGEIEVDGKTVLLERELKSKAKLKLTSDNSQYIYDNISLPYSEHVTRKTYEEIYALELSRLTSFKADTWSDIEDLLLNHYSGDTFKSPKQVLSLIEEDMNKIKRKTERGNSLIKSLEEERKHLFKKKKSIQENLSFVKEYQYKLEVLNADLNEKRQNKVELDKQLKLLKKYYPIMELYNEKDDLNNKLIRFKGLQNLDEKHYIEEKNALKNLYVKMDDVSEKISKIVYDKRKLVERKKIDFVDEIELNDYKAKFMSLEELVDTTDVLEQKLDSKEAEFKKEFENTFNENFKERHYDEILSINYLNVKALVSEIEEINEEIKILKRNKRTTNSSSTSMKLFFMVLLLLAGGAIYYFDLGEYDYYLSNLGIAFITFAVIKSIDLIIKKKNKSLDEDDLLEEKEDLRSRLIKELNSIRLSSIAEEYIGKEFLVQLQNLKMLAEQFLELKEEYKRKSEYASELLDGVTKYVKKHYGTCENPSRSFEELLIKVKDNNKIQSKIEVLDGQLDLLNDQLQDLEQSVNHTESVIKNVETVLKDLCDDDLEEGFIKLKSINHWSRRVDELEKKLSVIEYTQTTLNDFIEAYKNAKDSNNYNENHINTEMEIINDALNKILISKTSIEKDIEMLLDKSNLSEVDSELLHINDEIVNQKKKYDKLLLMHHIVSKTDEVYRKENQPEVFEKAGSYLKLITDNKYDKLEAIEIKEKKDSKREIYLSNNNEKLHVNESFSTGTLNQIYLSLRLALIDQLDSGGNNLPICFDELLINWDMKRLENTLKIIDEISKRRQVFIFTCHEWFTEAIRKNSNAKIHHL